jgi:hypothetical protein
MHRDGYGQYWYESFEEDAMRHTDEAALAFVEEIEKASGVTVAQAMDRNECTSITTLLTDDIPDEQDASEFEFVARVVFEIGRTMDQIVIEFLNRGGSIDPYVTCDILGLNRSWKAFDNIKAMIIEDMKALKTN